MDTSDKPQIPRFLLGFALTGAVVVALELAGSVLEQHWVPSRQTVQVSAEADASHPFLLWEAQPGARDEDGVRVEINPMGMRGPTMSDPKLPRERRLMVLGDGVGFGKGVQAHQAMGQVAVDELGGARVGLKAVNASVVGYSTLQSLNLMDLRGWTLLPDVLVIVAGATDWQVSTYLDEEVIPRVYQPGELARLLRKSALFRLLDYAVGVKCGRHWRHYQEIVSGAVAGNPEGRARLGPNGRASALRALVEGAQERDVGLIFIIAPLPGDLDGSISREIALYRQVVRDAAVASGAQLLEGGEAFAHTGRPASELWLDGEHPTAFGHRVLGRALAATLGGWMRGRAAGGRSHGGALPHYDSEVEETP